MAMADKTISAKDRLPALTGIRFFLALWVIVFHQSGPAGMMRLQVSKLPEPFFGAVRTGYLAVSVFFVLSGFILAYNYPISRNWSAPGIRKFAWARVSRIYPVYCLGLLLVAPSIITDVASRFTPFVLAKQLAVTGLNWTLLQSWIPSIALSWNGPAWSLSNEAFFYASFPFLGPALWRLNRLTTMVQANLLLWLVALAVPLAFVLSGSPDFAAVAARTPTDGFWPFLLRFNPVLQLPSFLIGIVMARAYDFLVKSKSPLVGRGYILSIPAVLCSLAVLGCAERIPHALMHNGLLLPLFACIILGLALGGGPLTRFLSVRPLVFFGGASYSMYILHMPLLLAYIPLVHALTGQKPVGWFGMFGYVAIVLFASALVFRFVEEPGNRWLKACSSKSTRPTVNA